MRNSIKMSMKQDKIREQQEPKQFQKQTDAATIRVAMHCYRLYRYHHHS